MNENRIKIGITHGDYNGISYEVIIKALADSRIFDMCTVIVYGSKVAADFHKDRIAGVGRFSFYIIDSPRKANPKRANLLVCGDEKEVKVELGLPTSLASKYAVNAVERAVKDLRQGEIDLLVTMPINKFATSAKEFNFTNHTDFLTKEFEGSNPLMFMISDTLKIGLATTHMPLKEVSERLTTENIFNSIKSIHESMLKDFAIRAPKIAVLGLNPHSGDDGIFGDEEQRVIIPAINMAKEEKILAFGPFAVDSFFGNGIAHKYDAILAMYHDQGLIPFKTTAFSEGVNYTAGLDIIRTSPAHGVAYDIAGKDMANPAPLRAAIYVALDVHRNREIYSDITSNPLPSYVKTDNRGNRYDRDKNVEDLDLDYEKE